MAKIKLTPVQKSENGNTVQAEDHIVTAQELKEVYEDAAMIADDVGHGVTALAPYCVTGFESDQMFIDKAARAEREQRRFRTNFRKESGEFEVCVGPVGSISRTCGDTVHETRDRKPSETLLEKEFIEDHTNGDDFFTAVSNIAQHAAHTHLNIDVRCDPETHSVVIHKTPQKR